VRMFEEYLLH